MPTRRLPPNCDAICNEQSACEDACEFWGDITGGEYAQYAQGATCVSCGSACGYTTPFDLQCLEEGALTSCQEAEYGCGQLPAPQCSRVCSSSGSSALAEIAARAVDALRSRRPDSPLCRHWALANAAKSRETLGRRTEAARVVYEGLSPAPRDCAAPDPWQDYLHPLERELDALRQAARK